MKLSRLINKSYGKMVNQFYGPYGVHCLGPTTLAFNEIFYFDTVGILLAYNTHIDCYTHRGMSELYNL